MNFLIITHVAHTKKEGNYFAYSPYVNEMNIWLKYANKVTIVAPLQLVNIDLIHQKYNHSNINFITVPLFSLLSKKELLRAIFVIPIVFLKIFWSMIFANHIHLRCPGNMGFIGSIAQILFPWKKKSAKYAGNWDANSKQPLSYRIQKMILSNRFLTHNIKVLVYGEWKNQPKNIKSFFTATYFESEIEEVQPRSLKGIIKILFVGTLSKGKQPLYAVKLIEKLKQFGYNVQLSFYGEGKERDSLIDYINKNNLESFIFLMGNADRDTMKTLYKTAHFILLPSKSEGWPKVVAEAMFWGCLPIVTPISCVPNMLNFGERGILLKEDLDADLQLIQENILNQEEYNKKIFRALSWSRNYTIDKFEIEIKQIIQS